jgi:predicted transcriptional regulator of viral defense system
MEENVCRLLVSLLGDVGLTQRIERGEVLILQYHQAGDGTKVEHKDTYCNLLL